MSTANVLDLPQELLSNVLSYLGPAEVVKFGSTCQRARTFISSSNQVLWRQAFLHVFDDPHDAWTMLPNNAKMHAESNWDWFTELRARLLALQAIRQKWLLSYDTEQAPEHLNALLSIIDTAKFRPTKAERAKGKVQQFDDRSSLNIKLLGATNECQPGLESLIHDLRCEAKTNGSNGAEDGEWHSPGRPITRSMTYGDAPGFRPESASRMHVLHGLTARERLQHKFRGTARRKVYNWSLTGDDTDYGPFKRDGTGRVNWSLLEGIVSVIGRNFEMCVDGHLSMPQGFNYAIPFRSLPDPTLPHDWARVTGPWLGTYSFLDYADLYAFNMVARLGPNASLNLDDEPEACGDLMRLELKLDNSVRDDRRLRTNVVACHDLPPLYFTGHSLGDGDLYRPEVTVRGLAALCPPTGREVRWKFIINYGGSDQWQLEGVQPGGIRSGGVYGMWSQVDHEDNAPIGPFCYFPSELCKPTSMVLLS